MWVKRAEYDKLMERALIAQGEKEALQRQVDSQKTTTDWIIHRMTQLEHERAALIYRYMDIKITVPELVPDSPRTETSSQIGVDLPSFQDVGDEEAKKLGLDWDNDGRVTQHGRPVS